MQHSFEYLHMRLFVDQIKNKIEINDPPKRIISLVPSQTELLADLGLEKEIIGITKFCIHPEKWFRTKTRVGGTKNINLKKIKELHPDLIIANKEENVKEQIEALHSIAPVWTSNVNNLEEALEMINQIGAITNKEQIAEKILNEIKAGFNDLKKKQYHPTLKVVYLIWREPYMTVGGDTFISNMLESCGFKNVLDHQFRYPVIDNNILKELNCDMIFLSSEPYPFKQKHIDEIKKIRPDIKVMLVDGEMFSWYGSRLKYAAKYFSDLRCGF